MHKCGEFEKEWFRYKQEIYDVLCPLNLYQLKIMKTCLISRDNRPEVSRRVPKEYSNLGGILNTLILPNVWVQLAIEEIINKYIYSTLH